MRPTGQLKNRRFYLIFNFVYCTVNRKLKQYAIFKACIINHASIICILFPLHVSVFLRRLNKVRISSQKSDNTLFFVKHESSLVRIMLKHQLFSFRLKDFYPILMREISFISFHSFEGSKQQRAL